MRRPESNPTQFTRPKHQREPPPGVLGGGADQSTRGVAVASKRRIVRHERHATLAGVRELRPTWTVTTPRGAALAVEYDTLRGRWRVDPGGYERRRLADALAQATAATASGDWIVETAQRLTVEGGTRGTG